MAGTDGRSAPTTLLAQNDVVPSMKTAINLSDRKNNFGTFTRRA